MITNPHRLFEATAYTLKLLTYGLSLSCLIGFAVGAVTTVSAKIRFIIETIMSITGPIPATSMLPFAILWFGLGDKPIIFITFFGSICPFLINVVTAFHTVDPILVDAAKCDGATKWILVKRILFPLSLPQIISGFRAAWGVAWRSVVAAELIFGAVGGKGGLGWLVYVNRFQLEPAGMLASLICISLIGIFMENLLLEKLETKTVKSWGLKT